MAERRPSCPSCGHPNAVPAAPAFLEIGAWDGKRYDEEFQADGHRCEDCGARFWIDTGPPRVGGT